MDDTPIQEGEIVSDESLDSMQPTPSAAEGDAMVLMNLESLIKSHLANIEKLSREAREQKETLDSVLNNDPTYKEHSEAAKDANKIKSETKQQILKRPDVRHVAEKMKELRTELGDLNDELTEYLREYQRLSGNTEIEGENGELLKIVTVSKLVRSSAASK